MIEKILETVADSRDLPKNELSTWDVELAQQELDANPQVQQALNDRIIYAASETSAFFDLPDIPIQEGESIGVYLNDYGEFSQDVFEYNPAQFHAMDCTTFEDISKVWSHECGHRILRDIYPDSWTSELGADFFAGVRAELSGLPYGNFEETLYDTPASPTHPDGELRIQAMDFGREVVSDMKSRGITPNWQNCLEVFDASPFAQVFSEPVDSQSSSLAAFVDDRAYHLKKAQDAKENAQWYLKRSKEASDRGDYSAAKDFAKSASSFEQKAAEEVSTANRCTKLVDTQAEADVAETKKTGGRYGDLKNEGWGWNSEPPKEIHHMPSNESSTIERNDGPSIVMDYEDHRETASCGNSRDAQQYRAMQKDLIDKGQFREALQMDVDDIHDKFGDKYDEAIAQMMDYIDKLESENKI